MLDAANTQPIKRLAILGVGLIGGSLARALRATGAVDEVVGCSRNSGHLQRAVELGVIDRYETDPAKAVAGADIVFLAVPLGAMRSTLLAIQPGLMPGAIITDGGSAKSSVVRDAESVFGEVPTTLVPGHPIAGREQTGVDASDAALYHQRRVILTPVSRTDVTAVERVQWMWQQAGAEVTTMTVEHHDEVLAATSHLPHMLAYQLVDTLAKLNDSREIFRYAAGGFRDFTRIASSDPVMWRDICLANRDALLDVLDSYQQDLSALRDTIASGDSDSLLAAFGRAKTARDAFVDKAIPMATLPHPAAE